MTFQNLNIPNAQSALAGLVLYQSWTLQSKNNSDCHQSDFFFKKSIFFVLIN